MRWIGYAAGCALVALGGHGLVTGSDPAGWALWFGGVVVAHDAVLAPLVLLAGVAMGRLGGGPGGGLGRAPRAALVLAGTVTLATLPTVLAMGRRADNPSILPLDYGRGLLMVLAALTVAALTTRLTTAPARPGSPPGQETAAWGTAAWGTPGRGMAGLGVPGWASRTAVAVGAGLAAWSVAPMDPAAALPLGGLAGMLLLHASDG
ncbi:hypothetical protein [Nonomuraea rhizosphaerae]|uniref:hypothetical protein n=1 Tax=Nonomuraea rhizosphaerae TaxID=2665663 RepID=UPI001C603837|nr:hypothetical protein [Nonomuraea rhizosphaerae]